MSEQTTNVTHHYHYHYHYYPSAFPETQDAHSRQSTGYVRQGIEILDKDRGILSSYGYYDVARQTVKYRRLALMEATQYLSKDYIQERLYFIAKVNTHPSSPFKEDLRWFEETYRLRPYTEPEREPTLSEEVESVGSYS